MRSDLCVRAARVRMLKSSVVRAPLPSADHLQVVRSSSFVVHKTPKVATRPIVARAEFIGSIVCTDRRPITCYSAAAVQRLKSSFAELEAMQRSRARAGVTARRRLAFDMSNFSSCAQHDLANANQSSHARDADVQPTRQRVASSASDQVGCITRQ